ncbi:DUF6221 family protein [Streptosporangium sp. NPDC002524]|uniref:DUF6221 family protein n=1 Tax=Streptosporangium sp. NPDC002524 TaxID=3154537 RepID=UPI00332B61CB
MSSSREQEAAMVEFYAARLAEVEDAAQKVTDEDWDVMTAPMAYQAVAHAVGNRPARVLARVASERRLLEEYRRAVVAHESLRGMPDSAAWAAERARYRGWRHGLCTALATLCETYSDVPGYRPEWAAFTAVSRATPRWLEDIAHQWMTGESVTARMPAGVRRVWVSYVMPFPMSPDEPRGTLRFRAHAVLDDGTELSTQARELEQAFVLHAPKGSSKEPSNPGAAGQPSLAAAGVE